jgi:hypothetical protein
VDFVNELDAFNFLIYWDTRSVYELKEAIERVRDGEKQDLASYLPKAIDHLRFSIPFNAELATRSKLVAIDRYGRALEGTVEHLEVKDELGTQLPG